MNITCPQCGFSRELPADRLPARAVIATCPKCACRFRFSPEGGVLETLDAPAPRDGAATAGMAGQDDPLPPGAIVPGRQVREEEPEHDAREAEGKRRERARRKGA